MSNGPPRTVFVERRAYRRRRLADAASLLPVLGGVLFGLPLLWYGAPQGLMATRTTTVMLYVFGVWGGLAVLSALVSRRLTPPDPPQPSDAIDSGPPSEGA